MSNRFVKFLSIFLGILMLAFGFLKFFQPFRGWFDAQIHLSHLPEQSILAGKIGEMITGFLFLLPWLWKSLNGTFRVAALLLASASLVVQMLTAIYVQLQPQVPGNILPLGIKPPYIPGFVLILALLTAILVVREYLAKRSSSPISDGP